MQRLLNKYGVPSRDSEIGAELHEILSNSEKAISDFARKHNLSPNELHLISSISLMSLSATMAELRIRKGIEMRKQERVDTANNK